MTVPSSTLDGVTEACARNAAALLKDADLLTQNGSHPRACALTILAFEEYAKAFLYRTLEFGVASYDCDISRPGTPLRLCPHVMMDHKSKHTVIGAALMGLKVLPNGFQRATVKSGERTTKVVTDADTQMSGLLEEARSVKTQEDRERFRIRHDQLANDLTQISTRVKRWEDLKERALYVDVENGRLTEPSVTISPESVTEIRESLDNWLAMNGRFVAGPMPKLEEGYMGKVIQSLKSGALIGSLPPRLILCNRCERQRRKSVAVVDQNSALPKRV